MRTWIFSLWGLCGLSLLGGCWRETGRCGSEAHCPAGKVCDLDRNMCVQREDPDLSAGVEPDAAEPPDAAVPPPPDLRMEVVMDQRMPVPDLCMGLYQVKLAGAVSLQMAPNDLGDNGANRLARGPCPGKPYIMVDNKNPSITNPELGEAAWECEYPNFYYGTMLDPRNYRSVTPVCLSAGTQTFTVLMPAGYKCTDGYYYIDDVDTRGTFRKDADPRRCMVDVSLPAPGSVPFVLIWFKAMPQ